MRSLGLSLFLLLAAAGPGSAPPLAPGSWTPQTSGVTSTLNGVSFLNPNEGFAVGASGRILRTLDGGTGWSSQTSGTMASLNGVGLGSAEVGCAVGDTGTIVQTVNGSSGTPSVWTRVSTASLAAVAAYDNQHAWAAGLLGELRLTSNGTDWPLGDSGSTSVNIRGLSFLTAPTEGYWVGDMGTVMKTSDGVLWAPPSGAVGTTQNLNAVSMVKNGVVGNATGWVAGDMGTLKKTTNSGVAWTTPVSGVTANLLGVYAGDATHAWAVGENSAIIATTNGNTWTPQPAPTPGITLTGVSFFNAGTWRGVAVGTGGTVFFSTNGTSWTPGSSTVTTALRGVAMLSGTRAVAVGDAGVLLRSTNGGSTWTQVGLNLTSADLGAVGFGTATDGWAAGAGGTLLKTIDGGDSWTVELAGTSSNLRDVKFGSPTVAMAVGGAGTILKSVNGGLKWLPRTTPMGLPWIATDLNSIAFGTPDRAVAVGVGGGLVATNDAGVSWQNLTLGAFLTQDLTSVSAVSPTLFIGSGGGAAVAVSFDPTAVSWSATVLPPPPLALKSLSFAPYSRQGYGVADSGGVLATKDAGSSWTAETTPAPLDNLRGVSFPAQGIGWAVGENGRILVRRSPAPPTLSFPPHIGTPYTWKAPIIDGFINMELTENRRPDTGWNQSLQLSYADGTSQPPFTLQGLRDNGGGYLYLSFETRADTAFDDDDTLALYFRGDNPSPRPEHAANDRRIIINPLSTGTGSPAGPQISDFPAVPSYTNSENGAPRTLTSYRWDTGSNAWVAIPASAEISCKVRSWIPTSGNFCWSVELKIPTANTTYTDWINIGTDFLFSFYALRVQTGGVVEASWPRDLALSGPQDVVDAPVSAFDWGTAKLGTANDGVGVRIKVPSYQNIGVTTPSTPPGTLEDQIHGTLENTFHVFVQNNAATVADNVQVTFRIADWGVQSGDPSAGAWHLVPANQSTVNPPPAAPVPAISGTTPGVTEYTCKWLMNSTQAGEYASHDHQCILVTLDSISDVNFVERSSWTNMVYVPSSRFDRKAFVSSKGYGMDGARKGLQRFYLHTTSERFDYAPGKTPLDVVAKPAAKRDGQGDTKGEHPYYTGENLQRERLLQQFPGLKSEKTPVSHYTWAIHAVKETSRTVKIHGHVYPLLEQANGFGYIARHGSEVDAWTSGLSGAIVKKLNDNEYEVVVPADGSAALDTGLESREGGATSTGGLFGLMLLILLFLIIIFWFLKKKP